MAQPQQSIIRNHAEASTEKKIQNWVTTGWGACWRQRVLSVKARSYPLWLWQASKPSPMIVGCGLTKQSPGTNACLLLLWWMPSLGLQMHGEHPGNKPYLWLISQMHHGSSGLRLIRVGHGMTDLCDYWAKCSPTSCKAIVTLVAQRHGGWTL